MFNRNKYEIEFKISEFKDMKYGRSNSYNATSCIITWSAVYSGVRAWYNLELKTNELPYIIRSKVKSKHSPITESFYYDASVQIHNRKLDKYILKYLEELLEKTISYIKYLEIK